MNERRAKWAGVAIAVGVVLAATTSRADIVSDEATAILVYPRVLSGSFVAGVDQETIIQLTNTSNVPQNVHCFYIDSTSRCSLNERPCDVLEFPCGVDEGLCLPRWVETDFDVVVTPRQPLAWTARDGLPGDLVPVDGRAFFGIGGSTNEGTNVPPVTEPFVGELKCFAVDGLGNALPRNVLVGHATVVELFESSFTVEKHSAVGIKAIDGDVNGDRVLVLGGGENEYNGCPQVLIANHFFDFAVVPEAGEVVSRLVLVPCTQNLQLAIPGRTTAQYLVFNEFEQRLSTSAPVDCYFDRQLSNIDTRDAERSIFSAFVAGTIAGQTRIRGVSQGLLGVLVTFNEISAAAANLHFQGDREQPDRWILP